MYSGRGDEAVVHSQGRARLVAEGGSERLDLEALRGQCAQVESAERCYQLLRGNGAELRPGDASAAARCGGGPGVALARLKLPTEARAGAERVSAQPEPDGRESAGEHRADAGWTGSDKPALPFAMERVVSLQRVPESRLGGGAAERREHPPGAQAGHRCLR